MERVSRLLIFQVPEQTIPGESILRLACSSVWGRYRKRVVESSEDMKEQKQDPRRVFGRERERKKAQRAIKREI